MITIHIEPDRRRFGRLRKRAQWRFRPPVFANGEPFSDRDTYANRGDITEAWRKVVASDEPVQIVTHLRNGGTVTERLR